jgi:dihydrofolate reductase
MTKLRVHSFTLSLDGYGAGPDQSLDNPLGIGGGALHDWAFATRTFRQLHGAEGGTTGIDDDFAARGLMNIGAWLMGRNMFGLIRGSLARRDMEGVVGQQSIVSRPSFRADPPSPTIGRNGRRNHFSIRHGWHP